MKIEGIFQGGYLDGEKWTLIEAHDPLVVHREPPQTYRIAGTVLVRGGGEEEDTTQVTYKLDEDP